MAWPRWRLQIVWVCLWAAVAQGGVCASWLENTLPVEPRAGHALAYDSARDVFVLFGGLGTTYLSDTWEYDTTAWRPVGVNGPAARFQHTLVYDTARQVTVLFGGRSANTDLGDTWEWNGTTWTQRASNGPAPRHGHAAVYDPASSTMLLFGGATEAGHSGETWAWDGQSWTLRTNTGPGPRTEHAMARDNTTGLILLFGGTTDNGPSSETWAWDGVGWSLLTTQGPSARAGHVMAYQVVHPDFGPSYMMLFGGNDGLDRNDTWAWDGGGWFLYSERGPTPRRDHAVAVDTLRQETFLLGGNDGMNRGDSWEFEGSWRPVTTSPSPRFGHAMVYDRAHALTLLFGGFDGDKQGDIWQWNGMWWTPLFPPHSPPPMLGHTMAYDAARQVTLLTGGFSDEGYQPESWEWDGVDWYRVSLHDPTDFFAVPSPRIHHAMVYDSGQQAILMFGGSRVTPAGVAYNNELWSWNGHTQQWTLLSNSVGPTEREHVAMSYDPVREVTVLFGGTNHHWGETLAERLTNQTWEWDGLEWTLRATNGPSPRALHVLIYDAARSRTLLLGGSDGTDLSDVWAWDGQTWTQLPETGPAVRYEHACAYDTQRGALILFGGLDSNETLHGDLWERVDIPADLNCDARVDGADLDDWRTCASRAGVPAQPACQGADLDLDGDVDQDDFAVLQRCYRGMAPADPDCD